MVGAVILYWVGMLFGRERMRAIWAKLPLVKAADLVRTEEWFAKHGTQAVFFGRMVPIFRSLISVPAGVERMRLPVFVALTTLGSLIWNSVLVLAGYWLGDRWDLVETYVGVVSKAVLVLVVLAVVAYVVVRVRSGGGRGGQGARRGEGPQRGRGARRGRRRRGTRRAARQRT
ncbi:hypothetical protein GCM10011583_63040 [Streptomyces camponoticapitis]|uniref:VTT domain-containing protein n=1 Tax=Streptomyces camponoticapitis TaxID=1616125 RepID=A0ABQ2ESE1_9ACTN|nr:hypothetical protein GCM10011583_63040 [Streptomyces camponoticapitis]